MNGTNENKYNDFNKNIGKSLKRYKNIIRSIYHE